MERLLAITGDSARFVDVVSVKACALAKELVTETELQKRALSDDAAVREAALADAALPFRML